MEAQVGSSGRLPDVRRERDHSGAVGLGCGHDLRAVNPLDGSGDPDHAVLEVDVTTAQLGHLAERQRAPRRELDHQPPPLRQRRHQQCELVQRRRLSNVADGLPHPFPARMSEPVDRKAKDLTGVLNGGRSHLEIIRQLAPLASRHVLIPADPSAGPVLSPDPIGGRRGNQRRPSRTGRPPRRSRGSGDGGGLHRPAVDWLVQRLPRRRAGPGRASVRQTRRDRCNGAPRRRYRRRRRLIVTLALSAALGWPGGAAALATVLCAWAYNLSLKATVMSWLPYAIALGMLP